MRVVAEFIMRGRAQAALVAILGVPVISQSALALVTLRRGPWEGAIVFLWAMTPAIVLLLVDWEVLPFIFFSTWVLATVYLGSLLLRVYSSWSRTALALVGLNLLLGFIFLQAFDQHLSASLQQALELQIAALESQGREIDRTQIVFPGNSDIVGILVASVACYSVLVLVLGRWWQALLFNPGGFRQEFSRLRLHWVSAAICALGLVFCGLNENYRTWSWVVVLPLVMVSVAIAHQFAARQRMGSLWLVIFYIALVNFPFYLAMAALGFADSWMDLRKGLLPKNGDSDEK